MNGLRNLVDKIKQTFEKGGKLGFLHSTFDAFVTFLFVPNTVTKKGAHVRDCVECRMKESELATFLKGWLDLIY